MFACVLSTTPTEHSDPQPHHPPQPPSSSGQTLHTTLGDIYIKLYPDECPKTVENFTKHSKNGYYDTLLFHRIIKGFMIQTGAWLRPHPLLCVSKG